MKDGKTKYPGVRVRGNSIQIDFRYKGVRCRETLRVTPTPTNLKNSANLLGRIKNEINFGKLNYADYFPNSKNIKKFGDLKPSNLTVSQAMDWWIEQNSHQDKDTPRGHRESIRNHIKPGIGNIMLLNLRPSQVTEWINSIKLSESMKNNILTPLRSMTKKAYQNEIIEKDIMIMVPYFTRKKKIKSPLKIKEVDLVIEKLKEKEAKLYYQFAIFTGLSTGEQLGARWGDVDFINCKLSIKRIRSDGRIKNTKNSFREREIELLNPAYTALNQLAPDDYFLDPEKYNDCHIFTNPITNNVWRNDAIGSRWGKALKEGGLPHRSPYETRHTFASMMITACLPDGWIRAQMGHATMKMLEEVYGKWTGDADKVVKWLLSKTKGGKNGASFKEFFLKIHS